MTRLSCRLSSQSLLSILPVVEMRGAGRFFMAWSAIGILSDVQNWAIKSAR